MSSTPAREARCLRVLALAPYPETAPSTRYRVVQLREPLRELGIEVTLRTLVSEEDYAVVRGRGWQAPGALIRAARAFRAALGEAPGYDAVLVQRGMSLVLDREAFPRLARRGVPLVYDFDDAVFLAQPGGSRWTETLRRPRSTTEALCRAAAQVLAGNDHLAEFARRARGPGGGQGVSVVPSAVDTRTLVPRPHDANPPTLGWVGSDSTLPYLEALAPVLRRLAEAVPHRLVVVAGDREPRLPGVAFERVRWTADCEAEVIASLDLGLYPLDETPWTRGKCGFKALQYLACAVPCVASPVGVLRDIVLPGVTGLHASDPDGWATAVARLLGDARERRRMGEAGRALVEEKYSVARVAPLVAEAVEAAVRMRTRRVDGSGR